MPDDNQEANCIVGICCGKDGKQLRALSHWLTRHTNLTEDQAREAAAAMLTKWEFAIKGTLAPLKESFAELARGNDYV